MEKLKQMKEALVGCVQGQVYGNLQSVDTKELGEAVDMIKDLSEAIYYCTITEAMEKEEKEGKEGKNSHGTMYYDRSMVKPMYYMPYPIEYYDPKYRERYSMYNSGNGGSGSNGGGTSYASGGNGNNSSSGGNDARGGGTRGYHDGMVPYRVEDYEMIRDPKEGKSGWRRKMYMDGKRYHDKDKQLKELESYMQELTSDMTEMIADASPEEKTMLQQKIQLLASKIK